MEEVFTEGCLVIIIFIIIRFTRFELFTTIRCVAAGNACATSVRDDAGLRRVGKKMRSLGELGERGMGTEKCERQRW